MNDETKATRPPAGEDIYRRKYVRVRVATSVSYTRDGQETVKVGHSSDLGGGGIRLATDEDLPLGTVLVLRFRLSSIEREILARGRIVLSFYNAEDKRFFHGIAFTQIDPVDQEEIVRHVTSEVERLVNEEPEEELEASAQGAPPDSGSP